MAFEIIVFTNIFIAKRPSYLINYSHKFSPIKS